MYFINVLALELLVHLVRYWTQEVARRLTAGTAIHDRHVVEGHMIAMSLRAMHYSATQCTVTRPVRACVPSSISWQPHLLLAIFLLRHVHGCEAQLLMIFFSSATVQ